MTTGRVCDRERGQATVELALVMPVLLTLTLVVVQVGLVARDRLLLIHAAREAARAAAVDPSDETATTAAGAATALDPRRLSVRLGPQRAEGDRLRVTVGYRSPTAVPLVGLFAPDIDLMTEVTVRVE